MKVIIIGGGQVGAYIAGILMKNKCEVKIIENRLHIYAKLLDDIPIESVIFGDGTDPNILESCGIADTDVVACVSGNDETNLVASTIAKFEFGVPRVIARVNNPRNSWLFDSGMGVDVGLNQADLMAHLVVEEMDFKNMLTLMKLNRGDYSIVQVNVDAFSTASTKKVMDLTIPAKAVLIAITRNTEMILPHGDTVVMAGDTILALADKESQLCLNKIFGPAK